MKQSTYTNIPLVLLITQHSPKQHFDLKPLIESLSLSLLYKLSKYS